MPEPHPRPVVLALCLGLPLLAACRPGGEVGGVRSSLRTDPTGLAFEACPNPRADGRDPFDPGAGAEVLPDQRALTVFNDGRVPGTVSVKLEGEGAELFRVMSAPTALEPAAQAPLVVRFSPRARGSVSATLKLDDENEETDPVTVNLAGTGADLPDAPVLALAVEEVPGGGQYSPCEEGACPVAFPDTLQGQSSLLRVALRNAGCRLLKVTGLQLRAAGGTTALPFSLEAPATAPTPSSPLLVAPGEEHQHLLAVRFAPPRTGENGSALAELVVQTNDPTAPEVVLDLFGQSLAPALSITPEVCDLSATGNACSAVLSGGASTGSFTVRNDGSAPLTLGAASFLGGGREGRFQLSGSVAGQPLAPGGALPLQVLYRDAELYVSDVLVLEAQSGGQPAGRAELRVSGGKPPALATEPADRLVFSGGPATTRQVTVRNEAGGGPLVIQGVTLDATSESTFRLVGAEALVGATLQAGGSRTFGVEYVPPVTGGGVTGAVRIEANLPPSGLFILPVEG